MCLKCPQLFGRITSVVRNQEAITSDHESALYCLDVVVKTEIQAH